MIRKIVIFTAVALSLLPLLSARAQTYFPPLNTSEWATTAPTELGMREGAIDSLYTFLARNNTKAFILLKDGRIVLEKYFDECNASTERYWASAGKSLTAFIVGLAQQEGRLSIDDRVSDYLGDGWSSCSRDQEGKILIRHLLTMTSGLDDARQYQFGTTPDKYHFKADAGTRWAYHTAAYTLLTKIIERVTGEKINDYIAARIGSVTGMRGEYRERNGNCVFWSNARSMARFGLLVASHGKWGDAVVMHDGDYFDAMTHTSQSLNRAYGYLWWLNGSADYIPASSRSTNAGPIFAAAPAETFAAIGRGGQLINIVPSHGMVWIRMGNQSDEFRTSLRLNNAIWRYVSKL